MGNVHSLNGSPIAHGEVSEHAVKALEEALERARSGDVIGVAIAYIHQDRAASYDIAGQIGGYSIKGALSTILWRLHALDELEE